MRSSRPASVTPLLTLAAGYAFSRLRRDPRFFRDKAVLVTGGSRGLGLAIAGRLRAEGASLALLARDADELERARQDLLSIGTPVGGADPGEVLACRRGQPVLTFPLSVRAAEIAQAVFPSLTARALALVNRYLLPAPGTCPAAQQVRTGARSRSSELTPAWKTSFADDASAHNNEV